MLPAYKKMLEDNQAKNDSDDWERFYQEQLRAFESDLSSNDSSSNSSNSEDSDDDTRTYVSIEDSSSDAESSSDDESNNQPLELTFF